MSALKVAVIGCVESTQATLRALRTLQNESIVRVVGILTKRTAGINSDFVSLHEEARDFGLELRFVDELQSDPQQAAWLTDIGADVLFCVGWSKLLGEATLRACRLGAIGYHPAELPMNRGRHPIVWALALGLPRTASSFFLLAERADEGPIIDQVRIEITDSDDARTVYDKLLGAIPSQVNRLSLELARGTLIPKPQAHSEANAWRKRTELDGIIDWRMAATTIHNLVRALSRPYPGADAWYDGCKYKIWRTVIAESWRANDEPGKIVEIRGHNIVVRCGIGAITLVEHGLPTNLSVGDYVI